MTKFVKFIGWICAAFIAAFVCAIAAKVCGAHWSLDVVQIASSFSCGWLAFEELKA